MQHQSDINTSLLASNSNTSYQSIINENNTSRNETDVETSTADFLHFDPVDVQRVQRAIEVAGSNACGIIGIDVWMLNDSDGKLYHFDKGMNWINPIYRAQLADGTDEENEEKIQILHRLVDTDNPEYYHPIPQPSGVGLAGNYWQYFGDVAGSASYFQESLVWREVRAFTSDPDQMPYERGCLVNVQVSLSTSLESLRGLLYFMLVVVLKRELSILRRIVTLCVWLPITLVQPWQCRVRGCAVCSPGATLQEVYLQRLESRLPQLKFSSQLHQRAT